MTVAEDILTTMETAATAGSAAVQVLEHTRWVPGSTVTAHRHVPGRTLVVRLDRNGNPIYERFLDASTDIIQAWQTARLTREEALLIIGAAIPVLEAMRKSAVLA